MAQDKAIYDVFISYAASDREIAQKLVETLESMGLRAFDPVAVPVSQNLGDAIWEALAESVALVVIVSPNSPQHSSGIEVGAALAWNKPIFVLLNGPSSTKSPDWLSSYPAFPVNRMEDIGRAIQASRQALSSDDIRLLSEVYQEIGVPTDQLTIRQSDLKKITQRFNKRSGKQLSGERIRQELLRLRKRGELPKLSRTHAGSNEGND